MRNLMLKVRMMITRMKMLLVTILERKMMEGTQGCYKQLLACQVRLFKLNMDLEAAKECSMKRERQRAEDA